MQRNGSNFWTWFQADWCGSKLKLTIPIIPILELESKFALDVFLNCVRHGSNWWRKIRKRWCGDRQPLLMLQTLILHSIYNHHLHEGNIDWRERVNGVL